MLRLVNQQRAGEDQVCARARTQDRSSCAKAPSLALCLACGESAQSFALDRAHMCWPVDQRALWDFGQSDFLPRFMLREENVSGNVPATKMIYFLFGILLYALCERNSERRENERANAGGFS